MKVWSPFFPPNKRLLCIRKQYKISVITCGSFSTNINNIPGSFFERNGNEREARYAAPNLTNFRQFCRCAICLFNGIRPPISTERQIEIERIATEFRVIFELPLISAADSKIENLWENFLTGAARAIHHPEYLGRRMPDGHYEFSTYDQVQSKVNNLVNGLILSGYKRQENIGIFSINTPEWVTVDLACYAGNFVSVPLYSSFDDEALAFIVKQTEMRCVFASADKADHILRLFSRQSLDMIELIVVMDDKVPEHLTVERLDTSSWVISGIPKTRPRLVSFSKFIDLPDLDQPVPFSRRVAHRDDLATICYTSGTTGMPKGVMLTHGNILAELAALSYAGDNGKLFVPRTTDYHISYLPLAHVFERIMVAFMTLSGGKIGFYRGVTGSERERSSALMDDISSLKPTVFISVPRIYNRLYDKVIETVDKKGGMAKMLFTQAMKMKTSQMKDKQHVTHPFWDKFIFGNIREGLGGRVRVLNNDWIGTHD